MEQAGIMACDHTPLQENGERQLREALVYASEDAGFVKDQLSPLLELLGSDSLSRGACKPLLLKLLLIVYRVPGLLTCFQQALQSSALPAAAAAPLGWFLLMIASEHPDARADPQVQAATAGDSWQSAAGGSWQQLFLGMVIGAWWCCQDKILPLTMCQIMVIPQGSVQVGKHTHMGGKCPEGKTSGQSVNCLVLRSLMLGDSARDHPCICDQTM